MTSRRVLRLLLGAAFVLAAGAGTVALHVAFLERNVELPVGDAAGHLLNCVRYARWLAGTDRLPTEPFPPGLYLLAALLTRRYGADYAVACGAPALYGGLLAAGMALIGLRHGRGMGGVLLAAMTLAAPVLTGQSRLLLLDLPMTALVVWIWALTWESRSFTRPLPTLLVGVALAWGALVKYTLFLWVAPVLAFAGLRLVLTAPAALAPLLITAPPIAWVLRSIVQHALTGARMERYDAAAVAGLVKVLAAGAALQVALLLWTRWRGARAGLRPGAWLSLSALIAVGLITPWFYAAGPAVWEKVHHEAIVEVRSAGLEAGAWYCWRVVRASWPYIWRLGQAALVLELAWQLWTRLGPRVSGRLKARIGQLELEPFPGPVLEIVVTVVVGTWLTLRTLPIDIRYILPVLPAVTIAVGLALCRFPLTRWTVAPVLAGFYLLEVAVGAGMDPPGLRVAVIDPMGGRIQETGRIPALSLRLPVAPEASSLAKGLEGLVKAVAQLPRASAGIDPCRRIALVVPPFDEGRRVGLEWRSLVALGTLHGIDECVWQTVEQGGWGDVAIPEGVESLALAGIRSDTLEAVLTAWTGQRAPVAVPRFSADADDRAVRLYTGTAGAPRAVSAP